MRSLRLKAPLGENQLLLNLRFSLSKRSRKVHTLNWFTDNQAAAKITAIGCMHLLFDLHLIALQILNRCIHEWYQLSNTVDPPRIEFQRRLCKSVN